jgi:hypothetical protein
MAPLFRPFAYSDSGMLRIFGLRPELLRGERRIGNGRGMEIFTTIGIDTALFGRPAYRAARQTAILWMQ